GGPLIEVSESAGEDAFLQQFFHPQKAQSFEDISEADEVEKGTTDFENRFSEAEAYRMLRYKCISDENPNKLDRKKVARELNSLAAIALESMFVLYKAKKSEPLNVELVKMLKRYYGDAAGETVEDFTKKYGLDKPDAMQKAMKMFGISDDLKINSKNINFIRNLVHDGFASQRLMAEGKIKPTETKQEWKTYAEIAAEQPSPLAAEIVKKLEENPDFQKLPPEKKAEVIRQINAYLAKDHTFEKKQLFDVNAGFDVNSLGKWAETGDSRDANLWVGLSTDVLQLAGIKDWSLRLGVAVNPVNGQTMVGAVAGKDVDLGDQWKLNLAAGLGATFGPQGPALVAGASAGFTWMSKGTADSAWREKVNFGVGIGSSISFNLTDIHMGPYIYVGAGQVKDFQNQYKQMYTEAYTDNALYTVDQLPEDDYKGRSAAIQALPYGIGQFMTEIKVNMGWSDQELTKFYEEKIKKGLKDVCFKYVVEESASGLSEWGVGVTIDPVALFTAILTLGGLLKFGFVVSTTINVKRSMQNPSKEQLEIEKKMIADYEKAFPGIKIEIEAEKYADMESVKSREFAGSNLERIMGVPEGKKATRSEFSEFTPAESPEFKQLQKQFAAQRMELTIDPDTKMYAIRPLAFEACRVYLDRGMAEGNGLIVKGNKILVAGGENLTDLCIKRFDTFYPGEIDGAVQHTVITISDNPYRTMGSIADSGGRQQAAFIEVKYDREKGSFSQKEVVGKQANVMTYKQFQALPEEKKKAYYTSEKRSAAYEERQKEEAKRKDHLEVTGRALALGVKLEDNVDLSKLKVSPEVFIKMEKYRLRYRKLTTNATVESLKKLDDDITKENPGITTDQLLLYKERLFHLSMSEFHPANEKEWFEERLQWAETAIYTPFFEQKLKGIEHPEHITAKRLARSFIGAIRQYLQEKPIDLAAGQSLFTAVGTFNIEGIRRVYAATGQDASENKFREGYDYTSFLAAGGEALEEEQRYIAKILLMTHSELPKLEEKERFLRSRLAKKLFYLGSPEVPNPIIDIMGKENFEKLMKVYEAVEKGETVPAEYDAVIKQFYNICEKVREAQLGNHIPVQIDGRNGYAVRIGNFYFVIHTTIKSGYYEKCKNPSSLYNETILVYRSDRFKAAPVAPAAMVGGGAGDVVALESRSADIWSFGLGVIGKGTVDFNDTPEHIPPGGGGDDDKPKPSQEGRTRGEGKKGDERTPPPAEEEAPGEQEGNTPPPPPEDEPGF
ncbi:MAG TPA: hypothetical protein VI588_04165, partial [Candidatus Gracilibacteria bacterium]|nr:hypothetical protein [Candidatus Gracilibacteria bacterium]